MDELADKLSRELMNRGAIKFGDFTLTSGKKSKYYVDIKDAATDPYLLNLVAENFSRMVSETKLSGVELGAVPLLVATALRKNVPYLIIRKERKHGTKKLTIGEVIEGETIEIIEDVVTTGNSVLKAATYLRENGASVSRVFCVVDREEGGKELLQENGLELHPIIRISEIM